jgi:hypothetical protein
MFLQELNGMYIADLATDYSVDREQEADCSTDSALDGKRLMLMDASHTARLACA